MEPKLDVNRVNEIAHAAKERIHIVTSSVAYAVAAMEGDASPKFQLGTAVRMGLADEEVADANVIARMRWEYRSWVIGHALADISESIATFLNALVEFDPQAFGCTEPYKRFERLGLDLKLKALGAFVIDADYQVAIESITRARNCLIHRHGIVGERDCNGVGQLVLSWRGIALYHITPAGLVEFAPSHRGPAAQQQGQAIQLKVIGIERAFALGSRLEIEPNDLCTLSWCIQGITSAIQKNAERLISQDGESTPDAPR